MNATAKTLVRRYNDKEFAFRRLIRFSILKDLCKMMFN
jgi:hypothetical protein